MARFRGEYPPNWKEIAYEIKEKNNWCCVRCRHPHDPKTGYTLTIHHLDGNKANCVWWNCCPLCQRCHLQIQAKVWMERPWLFEHTDWFKPYVAGYYAHSHGLRDDERTVRLHMEALIDLAQGRIALPEFLAKYPHLQGD